MVLLRTELQEVYNLNNTEFLNSVVTKQDLQILTHHQGPSTQYCSRTSAVFPRNPGWKPWAIATEGLARSDSSAGGAWGNDSSAASAVAAGNTQSQQATPDDQAEG